MWFSVNIKNKFLNRKAPLLVPVSSGISRALISTYILNESFSREILLEFWNGQFFPQNITIFIYEFNFEFVFQRSVASSSASRVTFRDEETDEAATVVGDTIEGGRGDEEQAQANAASSQAGGIAAAGFKKFIKKSISIRIKQNDQVNTSETRDDIAVKDDVAKSSLKPLATTMSPSVQAAHNAADPTHGKIATNANMNMMIQGGAGLHQQHQMGPSHQQQQHFMQQMNVHQFNDFQKQQQQQQRPSMYHQQQHGVGFQVQQAPGGFHIPPPVHPSSFAFPPPPLNASRMMAPPPSHHHQMQPQQPQSTQGTYLHFEIKTFGVPYEVYESPIQWLIQL